MIQTYPIFSQFYEYSTQLSLFNLYEQPVKITSFIIYILISFCHTLSLHTFLHSDSENYTENSADKNLVVMLIYQDFFRMESIKTILKQKTEQASSGRNFFYE